MRFSRKYVQICVIVSILLGICDSPLGIESGTIDSSLMKYSSKDENSGDGRLHKTAWVPAKGAEIGSYIEVILKGQIGGFSKIVFQGGNLGSVGSGYVTSFKIEVRDENGNWEAVKGVSFHGN